jgi:peroxiredoxin
MAETPSTMLALGHKATDFSLLDVVTGQMKTYKELSSLRGTVVVFMCNHCPFVHHILDEFVKLTQYFIPRGIRFIAINSNDISKYPEDAPDQMKSLAQRHQFLFPYLFDEHQKVAADYHAACTPDFFVFNGERELVYRGQFDDSRPGKQTPVTGEDLRQALINLLTGRKISADQRPSMGCNIKWKK